VSNALSAGGTGSLGPAQATVCDLEAVETGIDTVRGNAEAGHRQRSGRLYGGQSSWPVEAREQPGTRQSTAQCLLRLARDSEIDWRSIAQPAEPPGRTRTPGGVTGKAGDRLPMSIAGHAQQFGGESPLPNLMEVKG